MCVPCCVPHPRAGSCTHSNLYDSGTKDGWSVTQVERAYRGSKEETRDLLQLYARFRGDMHQAS